MTTPRTAITIRQALVANMHDGDEGGLLTMSTKHLLDETCEIVKEFVLDEAVEDLIKANKHREAVWLMVARLGGCQWCASAQDVQLSRGENLCVDCRSAIAQAEILSAVE